MIVLAWAPERHTSTQKTLQVSAGLCCSKQTHLVARVHHQGRCQMMLCCEMVQLALSRGLLWCMTSCMRLRLLLCHPMWDAEPLSTSSEQAANGNLHDSARFNAQCVCSRCEFGSVARCLRGTIQCMCSALRTSGGFGRTSARPAPIPVLFQILGSCMQPCTLRPPTQSHFGW